MTDLSAAVADTLMEISNVHAAVEANTAGRERRAAAELRILEDFEAAILNAWRMYCRRPGVATEELLQGQLERWKEIWLYGPLRD